MDIIARGLALQASASIEIDVTTSPTTISGSAADIVFKGAMTGNLTFTLSSSARCQSIENQTTGNFALSVKRGSSGVALVIPQGETMDVR